MLHLDTPISHTRFSVDVNVGELPWNFHQGEHPILLSPWCDSLDLADALSVLYPSHLLRQAFGEQVYDAWLAEMSRDESSQGQSENFLTSFLALREQFGKTAEKFHLQSSRSRSGAPTVPPERTQRLPLGVALGGELRGRLDAFGELLEDCIEKAEKDPYVHSWRRKFSFVNSLVPTSLNWGVVDTERQTKWEREEREGLVFWTESITGRMYSTGGIPWASLNSQTRAQLPALKKDQELWESDFASAEPRLLAELLTATEFEGESEQRDPYDYLAKLLGIYRPHSRDELKVSVMATLYGAHAQGVTEGTNLHRATQEILDKIRHAHKGRTWGGKPIPESENLLAHWAQGSSADVAFHAFWLLGRSTHLSPLASIHDGALWVHDKSKGTLRQTLKDLSKGREEFTLLETSKDSSESVTLEFSCPSFDSTGTHRAILRWKRVT